LGLIASTLTTRPPSTSILLLLLLLLLQIIKLGVTYILAVFTGRSVLQTSVRQPNKTAFVSRMQLPITYSYVSRPIYFYIVQHLPLSEYMFLEA
jgi:hypothetical protein